MTPPTAEPGRARTSTAQKVRLLLAFLAVFISFTLILRTQMLSLGDLYSRWYGIQQLVKHGRNPYSPEVSHEIQVAYYGHALAPGEAKDEQRFAYPLYVMVLLWPMAFLQYSTVSAIALPVLTAAAVGFVLLCVFFVGWPTNYLDRVSAVLFGLSTLPMVRGLRIEQLSTLVAFFLIAAFLAMGKRRFALAGVLLALATIKPQIALLPVLWAMGWGIAEWRERKRLVIAFAAAMATLLIVAQIVLPGWLSDFVAGIPAYNRYARGGSLLVMLAGVWVGVGATVLLIAVAVWAAYSSRLQPASDRGFRFTTAYVLVLTALVMPAMSGGHNQILLYPAALLLLRGPGAGGYGIRVFVAAILVWTPFAALVDWLSNNVDATRRANTLVWSAVPLIVLVLLIRYGSRQLSGREPSAA
jgi:hypothetical protein